MGIFRRMAGKAEGAVNRHIEGTLLGGDQTEKGEFRAMGGVRGFLREVHSAAKEGRDFGAPRKTDEPPWGTPAAGHNPNLHPQQFKGSDEPPW